MANPASIVNYSTLVSALTEYLIEDDLATNDIPLFITLAENEMNKELRLESVCTKLQSGVLTSPLAVPADYLDEVVFRLTSAGPPLERLSPVSFAELPERLVSGIPMFYSIVRGNFEFAPTPQGQTYEHFYLGKLTPLTSVVTTNELIPGFPLLYLAGALVQAYLYFEDDENTQKWKAVYDKAAASAGGQEMRRRWNANSVMRRS